jgi:cellulose synthase/poly-beta-1,6-N-acetylglucosamine synthase-like glycosyltransferase
MFHEVLFYVSLGTLLLMAATAVEFMIGNRRLRRLEDIGPASDSFPPVSIIITARNEAQKIEAALQSVLNQDYPELEIIVVNDRSGDDTGKILERVADRMTGNCCSGGCGEPRLAGSAPVKRRVVDSIGRTAFDTNAATPARLRVVTVTDLPAGWLGKNHAAHTGAQRASGELILFTDADVVMERTVVSRAVNFLRAESLDWVSGHSRAVSVHRVAGDVEDVDQRRHQLARHALLTG